MHVLVVDNDDMICELYSHMLVCLGHSAIVVNSREAALAIIGQQFFDAAFVDLYLTPCSWQEDGLVVATECVEKAVPRVCIVTGFDVGISTKHRAQELGILVESKPVDLNWLRSYLA